MKGILLVFLSGFIFNQAINANELDKASLIQVASSYEAIQALNNQYEGKNISLFFTQFGKSSVSNKLDDGSQYFYGAGLNITVLVTTDKSGIIRFVRAIK